MKRRLNLFRTTVLLSLLFATVNVFATDGDMKLEFDTNESAGTTITLPLQGAVNLTVNWGDGNTEIVTSPGNLNHTYDSEGVKTVTISGELPQFGRKDYPNADKLVAVLDFGDLGITSLVYAFYNSINLSSVPSSLPETVTDMSNMFSGATSFNGDISSWNVSSVTDMNNMFYLASSFNGNLNSWNVSAVTNMIAMFYKASSFNGDISTWNVSSVTNMGSMFSGASSFNGDINDWNVTSVTRMESMFDGASSFNGDISDWDVSSVTDMGSMFDGASSFNGDISDWNVSSVTNMGYMFAEASSFDKNLNSWDVSSVTDMSKIFLEASSFNGDISDWNVSSVTNMKGMFDGASSFNGDISDWDVSAVTNTRAMFLEASLFNGDLSDWNVSSVTNMRGVFYGASSFNGDISDWDVSAVTDMGRMFDGASSFNSDISAWDVSSVTNMEAMFDRATSFNGDISSWDVSSVANMKYMFASVTLPTANYDAMLKAWSKLTLQADVVFQGGNSTYSDQASRDILTNAPNNWTITDGGTNTQTITFSNITAIYGDMDFELGAEVSSGLSVSYTSSNTEVATITNDNKIHILKSGTCNILAKQEGNDSYLAAEQVSVILTISQKTINVTANAKTKVYGDADPTLTYTTDELVGDDTFSGELERESGEDVDSYAILQNTLTAGNNYNIAFTGATFTISQKIINVTADDQTKGYGDADPALTYTADALVEDDTFSGELARESGEDAADYAISQNTLTAGNNYNIAFTEATFTIREVNKAPTAIQLSNTTITENSAVGREVGTLTASDVNVNQTFTYTITENENFDIAGDKLISKVVFDYETKESYTVELTVADQDGLSFEEMLTIQIENVNEAPEFISDPVLEARVGEQFTYTIEYRDVDASGCIVTAFEIPSWLSFTDNEDGTAALSGIPTEAGTFNVILEASDNEYTAQQKFEIEVQTVTGIEDVFSETTVQIYPNPVVNELHINLSDLANHDFSIALYNMNGSQIFKEQHQSIAGEAIISKSVQYLRSGVYLLVIESEGHSESYKIVKQ